MAPRGRDATIAEALLREAGTASLLCRSVAEVHEALSDQTTCAVFTEEALGDADIGRFCAWIAAQPPWSDLPVLVLVDQGGGLERNPVAARMSEMLGNVTFLERPFHPTTFISVARTALKARERQFEARARLHELHENEERLSVALLAGQLCTWELRPEGHFVSVSGGCKALFGHEDHVPWGLALLRAGLDRADRRRIVAAIATSLATGQDFAAETRATWPDGSEHWLDLRARVVADGQDGGAHMIGVVSDISERKQAEASLRRLNETLEQRVRQRTADLQTAHQIVLEQMSERHRAEEQLRQVQKIETIGQLTGGVAHDFNNLLMAVLGNLQLLRKRLPDDARLLRLLDGAVQGARRGAVLTQRLLAFARRQDLQPSPVDLVALVGGMRDLLAQSAGPGIEIVIDLPDHAPRVLADQNQIESALLNLVINARDASVAGGIIAIGLLVAEQPEASDLQSGAYVAITVRDTGTGMDADTLARAIEPFFSTKEIGKGTGLGLSMVHGLAVQLHGALRLTSAPGQGTQADLWLPVAVGPLSAIAPPTPGERIGPPAGARILVVDDDPLVSASTVLMLEDLGHSVIETGSASEALVVLRGQAAVDLMITDYAMPRMTGLDLARAARTVRPGLQVLLATGHADLPAGEGTDLPRLSKPYSQEQLSEQITGLLSPERDHDRQPTDVTDD
jgi:PAS domain S-box-containing protein